MGAWLHYLVPYTKVNKKWIRNPTVYAKTLKFLAKYIGVSLHNLG